MILRPEDDDEDVAFEEVLGSFAAAPGAILALCNPFDLNPCITFEGGKICVSELLARMESR